MRVGVESGPQPKSWDDLPSVIAFLCFQRSFLRGLTSGTVKG